MSPELQDSLITKYPEQFKNLKYIECDDGWYEIISRLCYIIHNRVDYKKRIDEPLEHFHWSQIKEKFGGLRAYCYGADEFINGAVHMAESISCITCEVTGEKGKVRYKKLNEDGQPVKAWVKTLSDKEAEKQGYIV